MRDLREIDFQPPLSCSAVPCRIGSNLKSIAAQPHAAPTAVCLLTGILKMKNAVCALTDAREIGFGEQLRGSVRERSKQIFRSFRSKPLF